MLDREEKLGISVTDMWLNQCRTSEMARVRYENQRVQLAPPQGVQHILVAAEIAKELLDLPDLIAKSQAKFLVLLCKNESITSPSKLAGLTLKASRQLTFHHVPRGGFKSFILYASDEQQDVTEQMAMYDEMVSKILKDLPLQKDRLLSSRGYKELKCHAEGASRKRKRPEANAAGADDIDMKDSENKKKKDDGNDVEQGDSKDEDGVDKEKQALEKLIGSADFHPSKRASKLLREQPTTARLNGYVMMEALQQDTSAVFMASSSKLLKTRRMVMESKEISNELKLPSLACFQDKHKQVKVRELLFADMLKLKLWQPDFLNVSFLNPGPARAAVNLLPAKPAMLAIFMSLLSTRSVY
ncbi:unnamed protein product [Symbiodinium sp. CCMP2592]|nr:unnamed protein product [Symbiodinium sp. CCMP2592]CAE7809546.1 unnamed protein product [Symbiodinium sp. CCMP2592]